MARTRIKKIEDVKSQKIDFSKNEICCIIGKTSDEQTQYINLLYNEFKKDKEVAYLSEDCMDNMFSINIKEDIKYSLNGKKKTNDIFDMLKLFNLDEMIFKKNYLELSNGEKKKICIISILLKNSNIILMDRPDSYLDDKSIQSLIKILKRLKKEKVIIISSNNINFILQISEKVVVINKTKVIECDDKFNILNNEAIMNRIGFSIPFVVEFENRVKKIKNIRLVQRDNVNDLLKDIYRNVK